MPAIAPPITTAAMPRRNCVLADSSLLNQAAPSDGAAFVVDTDVLIRGANAEGVPRHRSTGALGSASA